MIYLDLNEYSINPEPIGTIILLEAVSSLRNTLEVSANCGMTKRRHNGTVVIGENVSARSGFRACEASSQNGSDCRSR